MIVSGRCRGLSLRLSQLPVSAGARPPVWHHRIVFAFKFRGSSFSDKARLAGRKLFALRSGIKYLNLEVKQLEIGNFKLNSLSFTGMPTA